MQETFGSTCHGAGRALSRSSSRRELGYEEVLANLARKGISIRVASPKLVTEEVPHPLTTSSSCINQVDVFLFFITSCCAGARVVQGRQPGGGYVPPGGHLQEVHQAPTHRRHQGLKGPRAKLLVRRCPLLEPSSSFGVASRVGVCVDKVVVTSSVDSHTLHP
jgi:hypothetical protein